MDTYKYSPYLMFCAIGWDGCGPQDGIGGVEETRTHLHK